MHPSKDVNDKYCLLYFKERVHDGNTYDAVINKVYDLNIDLSFNLKFCYEEAAQTFDNQIIKRVLSNDSILVYLIKDTSYEYIGKVVIDFVGKTIVKKECINDEFCQILFTASNKSEEFILKNGHFLLEGIFRS